MSGLNSLRDKLLGGFYGKTIEKLCCCGASESKIYSERIETALNGFEATFGAKDSIRLFSAPGRTEIGGNHTDHQHGRVLAASINRDIIAVAAPNGEAVIRVKSEGFPLDEVDLRDLSVRTEEYGYSAALLRGIAAGLSERGYTIGGFDAYTVSNVPKGSGLSSSAAFEVLLGCIMSRLYGNEGVTPLLLAQIGQYAENVYFGKPSGLMDQAASAVGGVVAIDFASTENPLVESVPFDFSASGFALCTLDSGADHANLTESYAEIPREMRAVAAAFGKSYLREVDENEFAQALPSLRSSLGDRACLRAMHFFTENNRVPQQATALQEGRFDDFLALVNASGRSSALYLQNVSVAGSIQAQELMMTLALCERYLGAHGASRVHGGGFAGTALAFVPKERLQDFRSYIEAVLGAGACHELSIRPVGVTEISPESEAAIHG